MPIKIRKKKMTVDRILHKAVKQFSKGHFGQSWSLLSTLESQVLSAKDLRNLHKVFNLLVLGELFGLHNPGQIAACFGISSGNLYRTWRKFSPQQIMNLANDLFWVIVQDRLLKLGRQSESTWSRQEVTVVLDSSIYKLFLSAIAEEGAMTRACFDKFFSGQFHSAVYGFRLTVIGIVIDGLFYPLNFYVSAKSQDEVEVGAALVKRVGKKLAFLKTWHGIEFPNLYLSVDNAFCAPKFLDACKDSGIDPISVPTKTWLFEIDGKSISLKAYIETLVAKEAAGEKDVFPRRVRAFRAGFGEVVLLFFRLNKGKKVNVIMTPRLDTKAITLRHRWFQRTEVEQFFRFSKHTLKFQETKTENVAEFIRNVALNFLKVTLCQIFKRFCRKHYKALKNWSFHKLRAEIAYRQISPDFLAQILNNYDDLLQG